MPGHPGIVAANNAASVAVADGLPIELTATLTDPVNIDLKWKCHIPDVAGYFIDFNMGADTRFRILDIVLAEVTTYRHPRLMPDTRFAYRLRPFFGKASPAVSFASGDAPDEASGNGGVEPGLAPAGEAGTNFLRNPLTADRAAPSGLTATRVGPRIVDLKWKDNAKDEDGYLLEISCGSDHDFRVFALQETNTVSFRASLLPPNTKCYFRVRAFYCGGPSLADEKTTGTAPTPASASGVSTARPGQD